MLFDIFVSSHFTVLFNVTNGDPQNFYVLDSFILKYVKNIVLILY